MHYFKPQNITTQLDRPLLNTANFYLKVGEISHLDSSIETATGNVKIELGYHFYPNLVTQPPELSSTASTEYPVEESVG